LPLVGDPDLSTKEEFPARLCASVYVQKECPLFTKLPYDVRRQIWEYCLGHQDLFIVTHETTKALQNFVKLDGYSLENSLMVGEIYHKAKTLSLLPLLRTREYRSYIEALTILYEANEFHIGNPWNVICLRESVRSHCWDHLRKLEVDWILRNVFDRGGSKSLWSLLPYPPFDSDMWELVLMAIKEVKGLQSLTFAVDVDFDGYPSVVPEGREDGASFVELIMPFKEIQLSRNNVVEIRFSNLYGRISPQNCSILQEFLKEKGLKSSVAQDAGSFIHASLDLGIQREFATSRGWDEVGLW